MLSRTHACRQLICIFLLGAGEDEVNMGHWLVSHCSDSKNKRHWRLRVGVVTRCLTVTWLLRVQWLLNLRSVEAWTPAQHPPHPPDTFHLVSVCSTQREAKKKRAAQRRKESIPEISPKLSVWGQGSKVDQWGGMSGVKWSRQANVGLVKCFPVNLWPGGNTKHQVLLQDYPNRMEIRGEILTWWSVIRKHQP